LRYSPNLKTGSDEWEFLKKGFLASCIHKDNVSIELNRNQDRIKEAFHNIGTFYEKEFNNEPDTDFSLSQNRFWAETIRDSWKKKKNDEPIDIPLVIAGKDIKEREIKKCIDSCQFKDNICVAEYRLADDEDIEKCVKAAKEDPNGWRNKTYKERHEILSKVAIEIRKNRGNLIGAAAANTGKIFIEADGEVSEAIDFIEYYPYSANAFESFENLECSGKGVGLVISPWNFPIAIPCGGITASLAAGNTVIFKPASSAVLVAWELCKCFWNAGVSKNTLQFVPCKGSSKGESLTMHPDIDFIILTGGTDTGLNILSKRPNIYLAAETGGKNATIVTAMSDRDQAIKNVIYSAFGNTGQKCSATSLLVLEKEVYEDENFKKQLIDAAKSVNVGSAWDFRNKIGALILPPYGDLKRALTALEPDETWALKPEMLDDNPYIWTPGIKWGVTAGSYTHMTEFFGPLLGVICAENLEHAIKIVNDTGYGLTSGIESLDEREQKIWQKGIEAGNLYINRGTTGAIVLRQPFGGMKKSALGAGIKAGGPNYVSQFMDIKEIDTPFAGAIKDDYFLLRLVNSWRIELLYGKLADNKDDIEKLICAVKSYIFWAEQEFFKEKDYFNLRGQDNIIRYLPVKTMLIRVHEKDSLFETLARIAAAKIAGCDVYVSFPKELDNNVVKFLNTEKGKQFLGDVSITREDDESVSFAISKFDRIRYASFDRVPDIVFKKAAKTGSYISRADVMMEGRIELIQYFQEQSVCNNYHRYGNIGERAFFK
jgi:RHH-type transcriptional regulator, proline utilization regulon repressor / proline dehydrogenase / delta 1-pyrroline-5-carboxylate dehydrogenase